MEFKNIAEMNKKLNSVDIKGKPYNTVNQRVLAFRELFPDGAISTELISNDNGVCIVKAYIYADAYRIVATGHAYEKESSTFINKTSYIENCETSAVGRALGFLGIGITESIATYEEVATAMQNQNKRSAADIRKAIVTKFNAIKAKGQDEADAAQDRVEKKRNVKLGDLNKMSDVNLLECIEDDMIEILGELNGK